MRRFIPFVLALLAIVAGSHRSVASHVPTSPIELTIAVSEPAGQDRTAERVTSGVPIPLSATQSAWALFDGATEIPVQTTLLPGVRTPWVLLDFQSTVGANLTKTYTLREQAPTAVHPDPLNIVTTATEATVITGPLKAVINRTTFNLFDGIWLDSNDDGIFSGGEQIIAPTVSDNLPLAEGTASNSVTGAQQTGRNAATSFAWETLGPLRATLKVEGVYGNPAAPYLRYTTRFTFTAGGRDVEIEHLIRNSVQLENRYVKVQSAKLVAGGAGTAVRSTRSGDTLWSTVDGTGTTIELIPSTLDVSTAYGPDATPFVVRQNAAINVDANGGMVIGNWSYHTGTIRFDFSAGLTAGQKTAAAARAGDRLLALTDASWYSNLGALGSEHFGTLADETAAYQRWGWQYPTPGNQWGTPPVMPRVKDTFRMDWNTLDAGDLEADDVWMNLLMFIRSGARGYLDRADASARYWKYEYAWRSDGFAYLRDDYWSDPNNLLDFTTNNVPSGAFTINDTNFIAHNVSYGKDDGNHTWNAGLLDYYYLCGDQEALTAAVDFAERAKQSTYQRVPGTVFGNIGGNPRGEARLMYELLRTWEATADQQWKTATDHVRDMFMQALYYDSRGFYYGLTNESTQYSLNTRYPNAKYITAFMLGVVHQSLYRYWLVTGDPAVRQRIIEMADFALAHGAGPEGYTGDNMLIDYLTPGNVTHLTYDEFRSDNPSVHYSYSSSSNSFIDTLTAAYRLTGNIVYLQQAKFLWGKTSKRLATNPYSQLIADDQHVGRWMNSLLNNPAATLYPENGDLTSAQFLFYEAVRADETAPAAVTDLRTQ